MSLLRLSLFACLAALALTACRSNDTPGPRPAMAALPQGATPPQAPAESPTDNTPTPPAAPTKPLAPH